LGSRDHRNTRPCGSCYASLCVSFFIAPFLVGDQVGPLV
jgi:hypothetical protein